MTKKFIGRASAVFFLSIFFIQFSFAQKFTLSGYMKDGKTGEALIGATISVKDKNLSATSNSYGYYSLTLGEGIYEIIFNHLGFETITKNISLDKNIILNMELEPVQRELEGVTVKERRKNANVEKVEMGTVQIGAAQIKRIPAVLGEVDVLKSIQMLPGVSSIGEGSTGINVRGGATDQNLILQDEAPIYNASHALGFFSVFNPDAVRDVKLIKGGIPAIYGGRLSSVLDIRMKEGNMKKWTGQGGIGTIFSRLCIEGPLIKNKASMMIAARRSYADVFFPLSSDANLKKSKLNFYDLNGKINYIFNKKNRVYFSSYFGRDNFSLSDIFGFSWGNQNATLRWNHIYNGRNFANYSAVFSNYDYSLGSPSGSFAFKWVSNIKFYNLKADHTKYINTNNTLSYGAHFVFYNITPGKTEKVNDSSFINLIAMQKKYAFEPSFYISNEQVVNKKLSFVYGIRYNIFSNVGKGYVYNYANPEVRHIQDTVSRTNYSMFQNIKTYHELDPRFSFKYTLSGESSVKGSYTMTHQNIQLISNTASPTPFDIYLPCDKYIAPQRCQQISLGYFRNFKNNIYETSLEVYYKKFHNVIDFKDGVSLIANEYIDTALLHGQGYSQGIELFVRKTEGKLTGWVSYTLSRTRRQVDGINKDQWYNAPYNKTHILNITAAYEINKRLSIAGNFIYSSGIGITVPGNKFMWDGKLIYEPTDRNSFQIPSYNRADFSVTWKNKKKKYYQGEWVFSVYNLYKRKNPYSIYFTTDRDGKPEAHRISVFGSYIPSLTYNFVF